MTIDRIQGSLTPDQVPKKRDENIRSDGKNKVKTDKLEISDQAKKLQGENSLFNVAQSKLSNISEIRQTKIDEIRGKIASNYYNDDKVISQVAEKLAKSEELVSALANQNRKAANVSSSDAKKLSVVFNRIDRKFYDSIEVLDKIAEGLLKDIQGNS